MLRDTHIFFPMIPRFSFFLALILLAGTPVLRAAGEGPAKTFAPVDDLKAPPETTHRDFTLTPAPDSNGWSFTLEPYLWTMATSGRVGVAGLPPVKVAYDAKTILQHLDWGIMGKGEVRKGRWGLLADGLFAQLSTSGNPPGPFYSSTSIKIQQGMASLALAYRLIDDRRGFLDVYAGARYNYMGINAVANTDPDGINNFSDAAAQRILQGIGTRADAFITQNAGALVDQVVNAVKNGLTSRVLEQIAEFPGELDRRDAIRIANTIREGSGEYRELVAATAQASIAAAKNQLTAAIRNRVAQAEKKFARALARVIEDNLPTSYDGSQWWVDPIVGLRAQINFTRWLFLSAQGDVGGFSAGSNIAWNVQSSLGVNFSRQVFGELGYRYFYMDYSNGGALYDAGEFGMFCGIGMRF